MPASVNSSHNPDDFPVFSKIKKETVDVMREKILDSLASYTTEFCIKGSIDISPEIFIDIVDRIEKRRIYFHVFYKGCKLGEPNEGALICFWIAKLHPFRHICDKETNDREINSNDLNAHIAAYIFIQTIYLHHQMEGRENWGAPPRLVEELFYALKYRDISKESLMLLTQSFL